VAQENLNRTSGIGKPKEERKKTGMLCIRSVIIGSALLLLFIALPAKAKGTCELPPLMHQQKDEATLRRLEDA
jgi:hypothetical protein